MKSNNLNLKKSKRNLNNYIVLIALVTLVGILSILNPVFLSFNNFIAIGLTISVIGLISIGQTFCLLTGGFDLSVGQLAAFTGMCLAVMTRANVPYGIGFVLALLMGATSGLLNGLFISKLKINPLISTLAFMTIYQGLVFIVSGGYSVMIDKPEFSFIGTTRVFMIPLAIILLFAAYAVYFVILKYTSFGRKVYAVGGNKEAARISGVNVDKILIFVYMISGLMAALGGIVLTSRLGAAQISAGTTYALDSVAASVLGGTALSGGKGNILGSLAGVAIIGVLQNGLIMMNIPIFYQYVATGIVLIVAVLVQTIGERKAA